MIAIYLLFLFITASGAYRNEKIISAQEVKRDSTNKILHTSGIEHYGILVKTDLGNTYLLHSMPETGIVVTVVPLSRKWHVIKNIKISGHKTIGGAMAYAGGFTNIGIINYITGGTCIGTKNKLHGYLQN